MWPTMVAFKTSLGFSIIDNGQRESGSQTCHMISRAGVSRRLMFENLIQRTFQLCAPSRLALFCHGLISSFLAGCQITTLD